jgi:DNA-binding beta-propeller fold protein YncE
MHQNICLTFFGIFFCAITSCTPEQAELVFDSQNYPEPVGRILIQKCATTGCHDDINKHNTGGLSLSSWDRLFEGSHVGSPVIPYRVDQSYLMSYINSDPDQGISLYPTMPLNKAPLNPEEYESIKEWVMNGAPDKDGFVKFSDDTERRKIYITNKGCDMVGVFDAASRILMKYVDVGSNEMNESPHYVNVSPDGNYWYVTFFSGTVIQKYSTIDDSFIAEAEIGQGHWNTFHISSDNKYAFIVNWKASGSIAVVDLENMELIQNYDGNGWFEFPHGSLLNASNSILYVTARHGNFIYKIDISNVDNPIITKIPLNDSSPTTISWLNPYDIEMAPDQSRYFISCEGSGEIVVVSTEEDSVTEVIPVGESPQKIALSKSAPYLFVSCTEDAISNPGKLGSVQIIDYSTNTLIKTIYTGFQPHGIVVDDEEQLVYVAHRNIKSFGPEPHHVTSCEGRNGYVTVIDMSTLELVTNYKVEVLVDPFSLSIRN